MNPDSTISAIRPSMMALVSTTIRGSPRDVPVPRSATGGRKIPTASAAISRSLRLATVRPSMPSPRKIETPERQELPPRIRQSGKRKPEQQPHQQTQQQPDDRRDELGGGQLLDLADEPLGRHDREVRQDREPDDHPGHDPGDQVGARVVMAREQPSAGGGQGQPDGATEGPPKNADVADQAGSLRQSRRPCGRERLAGRSA